MIRKDQSLRVHTQDINTNDINSVVVIGMLAIDCWPYTRAAIESIRSRCKKVIFVYIDNGSTEESLKEIKEYFSRPLGRINRDIDKIVPIYNDHNFGVGPGWNQIVKVGLEEKADYILIGNNDVLMSDYTVDGLVEAYKKISAEDPRTVMVTANNQGRDPKCLIEVRQKWGHQECPDFSMMMVTPDTIEKIGMFTELFYPGYHEDNWTHWVILLQGWKAYNTTWAPYCHIASRTRESHPNLVTHEIFRKNRKLFADGMMSIAVDQKIADYRYERWLAGNPTEPHPHFQRVLNWCKEKNDMYPEGYLKESER